jgi:hypothetical protein
VRFNHCNRLYDTICDVGCDFLHSTFFDLSNLEWIRFCPIVFVKVVITLNSHVQGIQFPTQGLGNMYTNAAVVIFLMMVKSRDEINRQSIEAGVGLY